MSRLPHRLAWALWIAASPAAAAADSVDLSPASWPSGELEAYTQLNLESFRRQPLAEADEAMVIGTTGALAIRAGLEALRQGGSATDAALVTALTQITLAAGSWVSYAGILTMVHYDADRGRLAGLNGEFNTVLAEDDPLSIPDLQPSGRTALVPGFMAAVEAAHRRYGVLPWESLFQPAIYFAEEGFPVDADLAATMEFRAGVLHRLPETRAIFFKPDGTLYRAGDIFRQPRLAETLRSVARGGADEMYTGDWAERLVAAIAADGGRMELEDLRRYRALWQRTKKVRYRGYEVHGPRPPNVGGKFAARVFKRLRRTDLAGLGHYTESADVLYEMLATTRNIYRWVPPLHSDAVIAVDRRGNVASLLHSINTYAWGLTGLFVGGVSIPDPAANQQRRVLAAGPGNRLWTSTNPLIVTRGKRPVLASSAIGRGLMEATIQGIVNVLDYGMDPEQAIGAGEIRAPLRLDEGGIGATLVTGRDFPPALLDAVRQRGIPIETRGFLDFDSRGYWIGLTLDPQSGRLAGATTGFFNGAAIGD